MTNLSVFGIRMAVAAEAATALTTRSSYEEARTTLVASGPLSPWRDSYSTFAPSARVLNPSPLMLEWWTKRSLPPSSGAMNPYPLLSLNHFTVPLAIEKHLLTSLHEQVREAHKRTTDSL